MKKTTIKTAKDSSSIFNLTLRLWLVLIITIGLAVLIIWVLWPVRQKSLQIAHVQHFSFAEAQREVAMINQTEKDNHVKPECYSKLSLHDRPTAKAILMFHGISACSLSFSGLAQYFYDQGYNVYTPLAPEHGRVDNLNHAKVTKQSLVDFANESVNITTALGDQVGVAGLSGGGDLSTWVIQYRPEIKRALVLSPFYEPASAQAPKWQIRPLLVFYGNNFLPDKLNKSNDPQHALSYRALAKYVTIFKNLPEPAKDTGLQNLALVMADDDDQIDQPLAVKTLNGIAKANHQKLLRYQIPAELKLGHDIVSLDNAHVAQNQAFLYQKYFELYEQ